MAKANMLVIQHVPFERPGIIADWAYDNHIDYQIFHINENKPLPSPENFNFLIVMGGPMSVNDHQKYPWITREIGLIQDCLYRKIPIVGICLGAQFLAKALGSRVYQSTNKEIGWYPVHFESSFFPFTTGHHKNPIVFHWHGETFDLPEGCLRLASSEITPNQLFIYNNHALGIQFHIEVKPENVRELIDHCRDELLEHGPSIMSENDILLEKVDYIYIHRMLYDWLDYMFLPG